MSCSAIVNAQLSVSDNEATKSSAESDMSLPEPSVQVMVDKRLNTMPSGAIYLSNKERLLLRKQALKMKKRPVLAVGNCSFSITCPVES